jgi:DNA-binding NarL/FixJ family response regulator
MLRVILVGSAADLRRLRAAVAESAIQIIGEAPSVAEAQESGLHADAFLIASPHASPQNRSDEVIQETLTPREIQILELLAEGLSNKSIAARLAISDQTVKFHLAIIFDKLAAANRTDAVRRAARRGLITL